jgi:glycosyltransferase involved in cell wall biosynthesis
MVSIIIPACNEEAVIGRTLSGLLKDADSSDMEIIVCCNGCHDRTAEIARAFSPTVRVIETSKGSKTWALNLGDAAATSFPRIYVDADISLTYATVQKIVGALSQSETLAAAPRMKVDLSNRSWAIRAFYDVWLKTPYHLRGMIGSGVYALSQQGRSRFGTFPDIIADDGFVRAHFSPEERQILDDCAFTVLPPASLGALLKVKTRATLGNRELSRKYPELMQRLNAAEDQENKRSPYWKLAMQPLIWPKLGLYVLVKAVAEMRARTQLKKLSTYRWERDETSRV